MKRQLALVLIAMFIVGIVAYFVRSSSSSQKRFEQAEFKRIDPPQGTFQIRLLSKYKQLLRVGNSLSINPLQAKIIRNANGELETSFWARRASDAFTVNWETGELSQYTVDTAQAADSPVPQQAELKTSFSGGNWKKASAIGLRIDDTLKTFEWNSNTRVADLVVSREYPFAFGLELREEQPRPIGIVWLEIKSDKIGKVGIPEARNGVQVIYKKDLEALLVFDSEWGWIMCIDLKPKTDGPRQIKESVESPPK